MQVLLPSQSCGPQFDFGLTVSNLSPSSLDRLDPGTGQGFGQLGFGRLPRCSGLFQVGLNLLRVQFCQDFTPTDRLTGSNQNGLDPPARLKPRSLVRAALITPLNVRGVAVEAAASSRAVSTGNRTVVDSLARA
jgi:hypothetical protein